MSFLKRLFSADYRAAVSAEAAGQLDQAAERYVLAGEHAEAARVHLARAERAESRVAEIAALRDALHWAGNDAELRQSIQGKLGRALLARLRAEGVATQRDKDRVRESAQLLLAGGDFQSAGEAFESIDDTQSAAAAYSEGGLVDRMEAVLGKDEERIGKERALRESYADYQMHLRIGERDKAVAELRKCVEFAEQKGEYRRLLDQLESRLITAGVVAVGRRQGARVSVFAGDTAVLGRDPLCELPLRSTGVSRRHAEITVAKKDTKPRFHLVDTGSKNGTTIAGMPLAGAIPMVESGQFSLGDHCAIEYAVSGEPAQLSLHVVEGMDRDRWLIAGGMGERLDLSEVFGVPLAIEFRRGRPHLWCSVDGVDMRLDGESVAHGAVQLIHGDQLVIAGVELEVS
ncbi:MAG: FHA domain-containing protein [Proteobacteria bacterium]|nr:FHA domain-containing protein [Pseudomonadota bacterium]